MNNQNLLVVAIKCSSMTYMAAEASRYTMAAYVDGATWLTAARSEIAKMKAYMDEIERLLDAPEESL